MTLFQDFLRPPPWRPTWPCPQQPGLSAPQASRFRSRSAPGVVALLLGAHSHCLLLQNNRTCLCRQVPSTVLGAPPHPQYLLPIFRAPSSVPLKRCPV